MWESAPYVRELLLADAYDHAYTVLTEPFWTYVRRPAGLPEHGWKLHVSTRAGTLPELAAVLVPHLLAEGHNFKLAASTEVLTRMNQGWENPAAVGKAVTIYPDPERVRDLGLALVELLRGHIGPRILSDRRIDPAAPVYYRYGPFVHRWFRGERGFMAVQIAGPDGSRFDALAGLEYRQPEWVDDPFREGGATASADVIGGHYRIDRGIQRAAQGNVFRGVDTATGEQVIVKQARPYVGDPGDGSDARTRLRNERRVLAALAGVAGVPRFVDHFAHGEDEFLVTTDVGGEDLQGRVNIGGGLLRPGEPMPDGFATMCRTLAGIVRAMHERDVIMRDVTPRNVVLDGDRASLVDFGISALGGLHPRGGTAGFAPARQMRLEPARPADDAHALGMTLAFAATGLVPVAGGQPADLAATRMLESLTAVYGDSHAAFVALVGDLISGDPETSMPALRAMAGEHWPVRARPGRRPAPLDTAALERRVLEIVLAEIPERVLDQPPDAFAAIDGTVYTGSAGLGLELLHHRDRAGVPDLLIRLATHAARATDRTAAPPGLYAGSSGTRLFLGSLRAAGFDVAVPEMPGVPYGTEDEHDDIISGTAGCGVAHLVLGEADAARQCVERVLASTDMRMAVRPDSSPSTDPAASYSHGRAGVLDLLLGYHHRYGDEQVRDEAAKRAADLAATAEDLVGRALAPGAIPLAASWCQGLAGIGRTLLHAATVLGEPAYTPIALAAGEACTTWIPRMQNTGQCCGLAGVGGFLIDCARQTGDDRWRDGAHEVARQLLRRSFGPDDAPLIVDFDRQDAPLSWATGYGGMLTFLRRLNRPDTPEVVPAVAG